MIKLGIPTKSKNRPPGWIITFADLMALMLTFFILLFSFSTIDAQKYKEISHGIEGAFNVEPEEKQNDSVIILEELSVDEQPIQKDSIVRLLFTKYAKKQLENEISKGLVEINTEDDKTVIRFPERVTFPSGSADLNQNFLPVLFKIKKLLARSEGPIVVSGHTDDFPISNEQYRSNWELSSSRAVSVVHKLLDHSNLKSNRFIVQGHAETKPLQENSNTKNRARNRRVEIEVDNKPLK